MQLGAPWVQWVQWVQPGWTLAGRDPAAGGGAAGCTLQSPAGCARLYATQADLFGDIADAKEAAEFASAYKEAKKCRRVRRCAGLLPMPDAGGALEPARLSSRRPVLARPPLL